MKKIFLLVALVFGLSTQVAQAQTPKLKVGTNPTTLESSAALEVQSTNQGFLPPRMNLNQITAIASPAEGLSVYCTDCSPKVLLSFDGTNWVNANGQQPVAAPAAPTSPVATAGTGSASVAFTAPASTGSGAIVSYTVTSFPGGRTATGTASPIVVGNLIAGTAYTFTVRATNASGLTATSVQTNSVTPTAGVPQAPTALVASSALGQSVSIAFTAPTNNGGSPITGYTVTSTPGGITATGTVSPIVINGLTNGTAYTFTIVATNAQGNSVASAASNSVTPQASAPVAPAIGAATISGTTASVAFTAPANNGGSAITSYTVTSTPGGITATGTASPISVPGLNPGVAYTFTVTTTNSAGTSVASAASNTVTASGAPSAPAAITASGLSSTSASVSFATPSANGSPITGYTITPSPATSPATFIGSSSPITVTGLTAGAAYTFSVTATNASGTSAPGTTTFTLQNQVPGAPTGQFATAGNAQATISFTVPSNNGGTAITGYTVTSSPGSITASGSASPITVSGLTNGTAYTFTVVATNAQGSSSASGATNSVTPSATVNGAVTTSNVTSNAAYSLRKVISTYNGSAIQVRRSNDNAIQNIGFAANGDLNEAALTSFVGTNNGFVTIWYDQSGNNRNATNADAATQPQIVNNGVVYKYGSANRPAIYFVNKFLNAPYAADLNSVATNAVAAQTGTGQGTIVNYSVASDPAIANHFRFDNGSIVVSRFNGGSWTPTFSTSSVGSNLSVLTALYKNNNNTELRVAGNSNFTATTSTAPAAQGATIWIGRFSAFDSPLTGYISEVTVMPSTTIVSQLSNLEANQLVYYGNGTAVASPSNVTATAGNATASVSFISVAGATSYTVTSNPGNFTATGTTTPIQVSGLTNGTAYTFTVVATNATGNSQASSPSNTVTPSAGAQGQTAPNAPTIGTATAGVKSATVAFTAPSNTGNSAITGYTVTSSPGAITSTGASSPITVNDLTPGTNYTFTVVATNSMGNSIPSASSNAVTPYNVPSQPVIGNITTLGLFATIPVTVINNGSAITNYTATVNPGNIVVNSSADAIPVNLPASGTYTVTVTATNLAGTSVASASSSFTVAALVTSPQQARNIALTDASGNSFVSTTGISPTTLISVGGTCPSSVTWQGVTYPTTNIGGQCWTARNSRAIPTVTGLNYSFYLDATDETSKQEGLFYSWDAAMNGATAERAQGVCPTGWHLPSLAESNYMIFAVGNSVGSINTQTGPAAVHNALIRTSESPLATNSTGFNVVLSGVRFDNAWTNFGQGFGWVGLFGYFWNSTQLNVDTAFRYQIGPVSPGLVSGIFESRGKTRGHSVRCLKD